MSTKDGFDSQKRWGNSAQRGHGVNSPAMMEARKNFAKTDAKSKAIHAKMGKKNSKVYFGSEPSKKDIQIEIEDKKYERKHK